MKAILVKHLMNDVGNNGNTCAFGHTIFIDGQGCKKGVIINPKYDYVFIGETYYRDFIEPVLVSGQYAEIEIPGELVELARNFQKTKRELLEKIDQYKELIEKNAPLIKKG